MTIKDKIAQRKLSPVHELETPYKTCPDNTDLMALSIV